MMGSAHYSSPSMTDLSSPSSSCSVRVIAVCLVLIFGCVCAGCHTARYAPRISGSPFPAAGQNRSLSPESSLVHFSEATAAAGIHYEWRVAGKRPLTILQTIGNGCAFLDYDADGNLDILLVGPHLALYRGDGKGRFTDVTVTVGLNKMHGQFLGCAVGDYDNDGFPDIYISAYRGGILLHNDTGRHFTDVTRDAGLKPQRWGTSCTFADLDGDGRLDLYIANYAQFGPNTPQLCNFGGIMSSCGPRDYAPEKGVLYHNEGAGRFRDVTQEWGMYYVSGRSLGVAAADFDDSGSQSLAIANDEMPGDLMARNGGQFHNIGLESGTAYDASSAEHGGMGIDWGDYDNDGKLDLAVATFQQEAKCIYHNEGGRLFSEQSHHLNIAIPTTPYIAFGMKWVDVDNDGWLDLVIANGHVQDNIQEIDHSLTYRQPSQMFRNIEGARFEDITAHASQALQKPIVGRGLAIGDYDNDGKQDILIVDSEGTPILLHNETAVSGSWLECKLQGVHSNRDAIGALVTVDTGDRKLLRRCATDGSYLSASDCRVHFGLGKISTPVTITVRWPGRGTDTFANVPANRIHILKEGSGTNL
jgi:hypothetical protein